MCIRDSSTMSSPCHRSALIDAWCSASARKLTPNSARSLTLSAEQPASHPVREEPRKLRRDPVAAKCLFTHEHRQALGVSGDACSRPCVCVCSMGARALATVFVPEAVSVESYCVHIARSGSDLWMRSVYTSPADPLLPPGASCGFLAPWGASWCLLVGLLGLPGASWRSF